MTTQTQDFLLELGTEELPPKLLQQLSHTLTLNLTNQLDQLKLSYSEAETFATPRRLAVLVRDLQLKQKSQTIERKGPLIDAPSQAIKGFAKSCNVIINELSKKKIGKADYYYFTQHQLGLNTEDLMQNVVINAIKNIPITKSMCWSDLDLYFVRPVHWLIMMLGTKIVPASVMGLTASNTTKGLRFTGEKEFTIDCASNYQKSMLKKAKIEVNFNKRKAIIRKQITQLANANNAQAIIDNTLLNEVCSIVECPHAFSGKFDNKFLKMPAEVLISAMKSHQKYFHLLDNNGNLMPKFIAIANINSSDFSVITNGNERVIRPRLNDAEFFLKQDKALSLESRIQQLDNVLFMKSLGSMGDKVKRIEHLSANIAYAIDANVENCKRAGLLSKSDLVSDVVGEFADLQGIMGGYYALNDGENQVVSTAISEHYHPRFANDTLPTTTEGLVVAIADKLDTITGIYGIGQKPTGSKDPYALRRMALGLLRIMLEAKLTLNLKELIKQSLGVHSSAVNTNSTDEIYQFMMSRLRAYYQEQKISTQTFNAILAVHPKSPYDFHLRIQALNILVNSQASNNLIEANKRIANILKDCSGLSIDVDSSVLIETVEKSLYNKTAKIAKYIHSSTDYVQNINQLIGLKDIIDEFFDKIMINTDNIKLKKERLNLINWIRTLFLSVADLSHLNT